MTSIFKFCAGIIGSKDEVLQSTVKIIFAALLMFPVLTVIADVFGIVGGIYASYNSVGVDAYQFLKGFKTWFKPWDAWYGLIKGLSFGLAITSIGCYFGFYTKGGSHGVGKATTSTVVASCVAIMIIDYILASILLWLKLKIYQNPLGKIKY